MKYRKAESLVDVKKESSFNGQKKILNNRAITLLALVMSIIVLLILAGVTISFVLGENGVLNMSNKGKDAYGEKQARRKSRSCSSRMENWKTIGKH